jgi:NAD(P)-dependent dehydrogenase (short-subunit alcohol dehydrogenase family)
LATELVDQYGPETAASTQEAAKPRKKRRSRKGKKSATAKLEEKDEGEDKLAEAAAEDEAKKRKKDAGAEDNARALVAGLDDVIVNPVGLGRRSRQVFDEVWRKFSRLGQMSSASSTALAEEEQAVLIRGGPMCEFTVPGAQDTTVLVVGATSRIGRIVVRKLMLRGYNVKVSIGGPLRFLIAAPETVFVNLAEMAMVFYSFSTRIVCFLRRQTETILI